MYVFCSVIILRISGTADTAIRDTYVILAAYLRITTKLFDTRRNVKLQQNHTKNRIRFIELITAAKCKVPTMAQIIC